MVYYNTDYREVDINMLQDISGRKLIKILLIKIFTSDIINSIINIFLPVLISIRCTNFKDDKNWWIKTVIICGLIVIFNVISIIVKGIQNKSNRFLNMTYKCYVEQRSINERSAKNIFRLNKLINQYIQDNNPINKRVFDKIADFQTYSFSICESIHKILTQEYGNDIKCEVTLMKKNGNIIKMLAYSNNDNMQPSSYTRNFNFDDLDIHFVELFKDLNGKPSCLPNKKIVCEKFKKLTGSEKREEGICQYIGIPIKTNRNEVELLLQIDVSKEKIFGSNEKQMELFTDNVLYPYAVLLHKAYERDLVFTQYYDMIIAMLSKE